MGKRILGTNVEYIVNIFEHLDTTSIFLALLGNRPSHCKIQLFFLQIISVLPRAVSAIYNLRGGLTLDLFGSSASSQ